MRDRKSSADVLLSTLVEQGFVQKLPTGNYGLGITAFEVGSAVPDDVRFGGAIAGPMRELADTSRESASLALLHGRYSVMVQRFEAGRFKPHHAFMARLRLDQIGALISTIEALTGRIEEAMEPFRVDREALTTTPESPNAPLK